MQKITDIHYRALDMYVGIKAWNYINIKQKQCATKLAGADKD